MAPNFPPKFLLILFLISSSISSPSSSSVNSTISSPSSFNSLSSSRTPPPPSSVNSTISSPSSFNSLSSSRTPPPPPPPRFFQRMNKRLEKRFAQGETDSQSYMYPVIHIDMLLMTDLTLVNVVAAICGIASTFIRVPAILGYLIAGSIIGPGGLDLISQAVQVETLSQLGIVSLMFALGLEFSLDKVRQVAKVAGIGGLLEIVAFMTIGGIASMWGGAAISKGIFVGVFVSMSSTTLVLKHLMEENSTNSLPGRITLGTLVVQDCTVGLVFAVLPLLAGNYSFLYGVWSIITLMMKLAVFGAILFVICYCGIARFLMIRLSKQNDEMCQLASVSFCLLIAYWSDYWGLSLELGAFAAGMMIAYTDNGHQMLHKIESIRNVSTAFFVASIGMVIQLRFVFEQILVLGACALLVLLLKTLVIALIVRVFVTEYMASFQVGINMAQVGEFGFVLLTRAYDLRVIEGNLYLLLLGTTALSLITTPFILMATAFILKLISPSMPDQHEHV